jgi:hypothetical protein
VFKYDVKQWVTKTTLKRVWPRIPYGSEPDGDWGADEQPCHDCGATKGQLHATGCDVERCPACGGQIMMCSLIGECERHRRLPSMPRPDVPSQGLPV